MYIDERLIKILETHKEEQIHVTYAIDLIKKISREYEKQSKAQNMRYINKNQITEFVISPVNGKFIIWIDFENQLGINIYKDTKEECIALAEKLGLTLID